jgi:hypothetical protein
MEPGAINAIGWLVMLIVVLVAFARLRRRPRGIGAGAYGGVYDLLNADKRNAVETIVAGRAEARDPEDRDGNLPELEEPKRR